MRRVFVLVISLFACSLSQSNEARLESLLRADARHTVPQLRSFADRAVVLTDDRSRFAKRLLHPPLAALGEDGLEVAFEEGAGVLEVLFGVGFGGGDALKRFVENADDPLLFGERGDRNSSDLQRQS